MMEGNEKYTLYTVKRRGISEAGLVGELPKFPHKLKASPEAKVECQGTYTNEDICIERDGVALLHVIQLYICPDED